METKKIWMIDQDGFLVGEIILNESEDYREGAWLIPTGGIEKEPPKDKEGYLLHWNGKKWNYTEIELAEDEKEEESMATPEMLLAQLNQEFYSDKTEINAAFVSAQMKNDAILQQELREELAALEKDYAAKKALIEKGENPWEGE